MKLNKNAKIIYILVLSLVIFGELMIYSASRYNAIAMYNDELFFAKKQAIGIAVGLIAMVFFTFVDLEKVKSFATPFAIISFLLLLAIFIPHFGMEKYGARRWLNFGIATVQPSELAKFALIIFASKMLVDVKNDNIKSKLPIIILGGAYCAAILLEPNLSITVVMALLTLAMLFVGGLKLRHFVFVLFLGLIALVILIVIEPYRMERLSAFFDPWSSPKDEGYQLIQSLYAIANGGLFGVGFLHSRQALRFLPFSESDFILAIIAEEFGLLGTFILLGIYFILFLFGIKLALRVENKFEAFLAFGISILLAIQVAINVAVCSGVIPPTGLPLPLISSGNTQIITFLAEFGLLANIANKCTKNRKNP